MATPRRCVLLVDDNAHYRDYLTLVLEADGYAVTATGHGQTAYDALSGKYHLLITDRVHPGIAGDALITYARQHNSTLTTILMSVQSHDMHVATACGADGFFDKSHSGNELLTLIRQCCRTTPASQVDRAS